MVVPQREDDTWTLRPYNHHPILPVSVKRVRRAQLTVVIGHHAEEHGSQDWKRAQTKDDLPRQERLLPSRSLKAALTMVNGLSKYFRDYCHS